jgi:putative glycosyltransferase (TIGR04372 family)
MIMFKILKSLTRRFLIRLTLILILLCNPFIVIKLGRINNKIIGHLAMETDFSTYEISTLNEKRVFYIWYFACETSCNSFLQKQISKKLRIVPEFIFAGVFEVMKKNKIFNKNLIPYYDFSTGINFPANKRIPPLFWTDLAKSSGLKSFYTPSFERFKVLRKNLNISNEQIACVHIRDSEFKKAEIANQLNKRLRKELQNDAIIVREFRNSEVTNFLPSANLLNSYGIEFVRVGKLMKEIPKSSEYNFIDYSNSEFQSEENDLLLILNSKLFIGTLSGLGEVARWARIPVLQIDVGEFTYFGSIFTGSVESVPIVLPKVIKSRLTNEILSISEIKEMNLKNLPTDLFHDFINSPKCPITLSLNSPEVILKTIELGINYIDKKTEDDANIREQFLLGQEIFSNFYGTINNGKFPAISPWWPNATKK